MKLGALLKKVGYQLISLRCCHRFSDDVLNNKLECISSHTKNTILLLLQYMIQLTTVCKQSNKKSTKTFKDKQMLMN